MGGDLRRAGPGLALLVTVAVAAHVAAGVLDVPPLLLAVALGAIAANALDLPERLDAGIEEHDVLLETAIVLLGAGIPIAAIAESGGTVVLLVLATVGVGVLLVELLARAVFALDRREGSLLAAGASICGVSAVVAVARSIDADRETLAYVAGAVLLFDAVTLVAFPSAGRLLGLPDRAYGVWAGLTMFSTGPVAAAGFAVSPEAGEWATVTKLVRNALIGVVAVGYAAVYARGTEAETTSLGTVWRQFPTFLVGFVALAVVANLGLLAPGTVDAVGTVTDWLFAVAFAGVGLSIRVEAMRDAGLVPVAVLGCYLLVVGGLALAAVTLLL